MKRNFLSALRFVLPVALVCLMLAIATGIFTASPRPAWAWLRETLNTPYRNVIVVAKAGGDFDSVQQALDSITDNSPTNRYLIWVAPGIYAERVTMKPYVDIEGAGERVTKITSAGGPPGNYTTLIGASDAELRYLTVENTASSYSVHAIDTNGTSPGFQHVTVIASNGLNQTSLTAAFSIAGGSPTLRNVTAVASGSSSVYGILGGGGSTETSLTVVDSEITASSGKFSNAFNNGMSINAASATVRNSKISATGSGSNYAIQTRASSGSYTLTIDNSTLVGSTGTIHGGPCCEVTRVGASKLEGGPVQTEGAPVVCAGVYDENYAFFPSTCP